MGIFSKFFDFLLYSNVWIAGSAAALYFYTRYLLTEQISFDWIGLFVFCTCVWLYSLHRYIGLRKIHYVNHENRFYKIRQLQKPIHLFAITCFVGSIILAFMLSWIELITLSIPGLLSLFYVLPVLTNQKRLRDINYIKIFIISLVWAGLTVLLPLASCTECEAFKTQSFIFIERFIFIFAITLPFDIRDLEVDHAQNVKTISAKIGIHFTWVLCIILLSLSSGVYGYLYSQCLIGLPIVMIHFITNFITLLLIALAFWRKHDWYYTGLLDGTMYLPFLLLIAASH